MYKTGCTVSVDQSTQTARYEQVEIVGEREGINEDGKPVQEWWVWFPQRPTADYLDTNGKLRAVNVPKYKILQVGETRLINGMLCKCP
jgi:hypothetical protein